MNPNRMANYRRGEKAKLVSAVEELCARLGRPVCSADLKAFFGEYPERRPCLLKRLGQQLIVSSEALDGVVPHLKRIGIFRYKAYYATDDRRVWHQRFSDYCVCEQIDEILRLGIPDHIATLAGGGHPEQAAHAASGWLAEIEALSNRHSDPERAQAVCTSDADFVRRYADRRFNPLTNFPLITREEAIDYLMREAASRRLFDVQLSPFRHLKRYRWPQSNLFTMLSEYRASPDQLYHFVRGKWPVNDEDEEIHRALAECLRYGRSSDWLINAAE